jgi:hypothetical protein
MTEEIAAGADGKGHLCLHGQDRDKPAGSKPF